MSNQYLLLKVPQKSKLPSESYDVVNSLEDFIYSFVIVIIKITPSTRAGVHEWSLYQWLNAEIFTTHDIHDSSLEVKMCSSCASAQ